MPGVAKWSEEVAPLSRAPNLEQDHPVSVTINSYPDLFQIITPVDIELFHCSLLTHPNEPFVELVCRGLEEGFWPWAKVDIPGYPSTNDQAQSPTRNIDKANFLCSQRDLEICKNCFSMAFQGDLMLGMYCMPIFAIPKECPGDFRLITHQSFGQYSLNSMTPAHEWAFPMDNMTCLGYQLLQAHRDRTPGQQLVLWKSNIAEAYRLLPMHPYWQIKQVNTIDDKRYIDRCNAFSGRRPGDLFIAFMSLVLWIAENCEGVKNPNGYVNNCFRVE